MTLKNWVSACIFWEIKISRKGANDNYFSSPWCDALFALSCLLLALWCLAAHYLIRRNKMRSSFDLCLSRARKLQFFIRNGGTRNDLLISHKLSSVHEKVFLLNCSAFENSFHAKVEKFVSILNMKGYFHFFIFAPSSRIHILYQEVHLQLDLTA